MKEGFMNKRGQVTIFIIIAIIVVAMGALIYVFFPQIKTGLGFEEKNPSAFIQNCIEEEIEMNLEKLSLQGGSLNPEHYILYNNEKIEYLCYTREYYKTCIVQQPMLTQHIEIEIKNEIQEGVESCFDSMEENYKKKGYTVRLDRGETIVEMLPKKFVTTFNSSLTLTKEDSVEKYDSFKVILNNNLYELVIIANSILEWEVAYGDAETTTYMDYYHNLQVEKKKQSDGTTIYVLTNLDTKNKFQFASKSLVWPPGYGL